MYESSSDVNLGTLIMKHSEYKNPLGDINIKQIIDNDSWIVFAFTLLIGVISLGLILFTLISELKKSKAEKIGYKDPEKIQLTEIDNAIRLLNCKSIRTIKSGLFSFFLQNIILLIMSIAVLFIANTYFFYDYLNYLVIPLYIFLHLDIICVIIIIIALIKTKSTFQEKEGFSRGIALWIAWIISAIIYRLFLFIPYMYEFFTNTYNETIMNLLNKTLPLFALSSTLFYFAFFYTSIILTENKIITKKWLLIIFSGMNWIVTTYYLVGYSIPYVVSNDFVFISAAFCSAIKLLVVPIIGLSFFILLIKDIDYSILKAKQLFIRDTHSLSTIREHALHPRNYLELNDPYITQSFERVLNILQFENERLDAFTQRAQDNMFLMIIPEKYSKIDSLVTQFLKISFFRPNLEFLVLTDFSKIANFNKNLKWQSDGLIPLVYEFNFQSLPVIFVLNNNGEELAKIEGPLPKTTDLLEGLIYILDIEPLIKK